MSEIVKLSDQRIFQRYQSKTGALVSLKSKSSYRFGSISDLSQSGLSFRYVNFGFNQDSEVADETYKIEILFDNCGFLSGPFPCKLVLDSDSLSDNPAELLPKRKCRVQFGELNPEQISKLEYFIEKFTN